MRLNDILQGVEHEIVQGGDCDVKKLTIDSRMVCKGGLFFCITGIHSDGHSFLPQAAEDGAAAAVIDKDQPSYPPGITIVKVADTRKAMSLAAANFYGNPADSLILAGVTGTNGKTSSVYFVESVLEEWRKQHGIITTVDCRACGKPVEIHFATSTTPDSIELHKILRAMKDDGAQYVAMEVTSHALALEKVEGVHYRVAGFTNLTQDHLDFHKDFDDYRDTKKRLYGQCDHAVTNIDDPYGAYMVEGHPCTVTTYSIDKESDLRAVNVQLLDNGVKFDVAISGETVHFSLPVRGRFTVYNALNAIGMCLALGAPADVIAKGLAKVKGVPGRIQSVPSGHDFDVIVDYSHTPDSIENILTTVRETTRGRVIVIFGCGGDRDPIKRPIMGEIAASRADYVIVTSDNPRTEDPASILSQIEVGVKRGSASYELEIDRREAIEKGIKMAQPGDTVVIAGKGHEDYQIFADRTIHFDDYEEAVKVLESLKVRS
ncbi:MAG: UDP-N-acetylmuramoyl-L-alanyl-D-glutamate--2,6-diaminopimelate ligase [Defluviitaleaceae bacterium]|nr:UDP-N-acetylmuramoyl-L-alanyl-D-glutamate--2,6-diaminopimelate ligase [Defluviitaleaceae bacterium]